MQDIGNGLKIGCLTLVPLCINKFLCKWDLCNNMYDNLEELWRQTLLCMLNQTKSCLLHQVGNGTEPCIPSHIPLFDICTRNSMQLCFLYVRNIAKQLTSHFLLWEIWCLKHKQGGSPTMQCFTKHVCESYASHSIIMLHFQRYLSLFFSHSQYGHIPTHISFIVIVYTLNCNAQQQNSGHLRISTLLHTYCTKTFHFLFPMSQLTSNGNNKIYPSIGISDLPGK